MGLRFSQDDLFDVPRRYAPFALMRAGHSCRAHNVIYGRREGLAVRAFDFHYEIGHGPARSTRRYWCVVVETDRDLCRLILWNHMDRQTAPLEAMRADQEYRQWALRGSAQDAGAVAPLMNALADQGASCQSCGQVFMMCLPAHSKVLAEASQFEIAVAIARALCVRSAHENSD
jgi:hypothetical protein